MPHSSEATVKPTTATEQQRLAAQPVGEPAGQRRRDGRGDDIGGQHPVDLVLRRAEAGAHMGQGDIGDGGVEHLHHRGQHDAGGQQALVLDQ